MKKISFIIPSRFLKRPKNKRYLYKKTSNIQDVINDIQESVKLEYEIIVICNGLQDKKLVEFIMDDKRINKYSILNNNCGVARAWNIGANLAETDLLCFVNDDLRLGPQCIEKMVSYLDQHEDVAEIGPLGAFWKNGEHERLAEGDQPMVVDAVAGFLFILKTSIFFQLGGFDNAYTPAGYEEIDMSFKINRLGLKCVVYPNLDVVHHREHGVSAYKTDIAYFDHVIDTESLHLRNKVYFKKKWQFTD